MPRKSHTSIYERCAREVGRTDLQVGRAFRAAIVKLAPPGAAQISDRIHDVRRGKSAAGLGSMQSVVRELRMLGVSKDDAIAHLLPVYEQMIVHAYVPTNPPKKAA